MKTEKTNKDLISKWVNLYSDSLYTWAFHKTSSKEIAEDLVQDTFLSAYKAIKKFNHKSRPNTWLFSILNNKIIDYYRKSSKQIKLISDEELTSIQQSDSLFDTNNNWRNTTNNTHWETEENILDNPKFKITLENCISKLPEKWKIALLGKYTLEKKSEEICKELNITTSNYWQIVHRAKLQLRACIEKNWVK